MSHWRVLKWSEKKYGNDNVDHSYCRECDLYRPLMLDGGGRFHLTMKDRCGGLNRVSYFAPKEILWNLQSGEATLIGEDGCKRREYPRGEKPVFRCLLAKAEILHGKPPV